MDFFDKYSFLFHVKTPIEVIVVILLLFLLSLGIILFNEKTRKKRIKLISFSALVLYMSFLLCHTIIFRIPQSDMKYEFVPFWSYIDIIRDNKIVYLFENILNVLLFFPLGLFLGFLFQKVEWLKVIVAGAFFSLMIEILQLFLYRGLFEFDDVFHNTIGCIFGYNISLLILRYDC